MPIKEIAQWIENNTTWVIGTNLFVGHLPLKRPDGSDIPDRCLVILENSPGTVEPDLPDRLDKAIQLWNRSRNYFEARDDAFNLFELIHGTSGWNLPVLVSGNQYLAMTVDAIGSPAPIENPDEQGFFVFSTNYIWRLEKASC